MSVDLHAAQSQGFFDGPVDHLIAMPVLVDYIRDRFSNQLDNVAVVSPDAGRIRVAEQWAQRLGGGPLAFVHKTRDITRPNQAVANRVVGDVAGKDCVLVDDLIDTAGTIAGACNVLKDAGAKSVTVVATHGVLSGPAVDRLKNCGAREVVLTDTVPIPEEKRWDGLTVLSIAPLLASAIRACSKTVPLPNCSTRIRNITAKASCSPDFLGNSDTSDTSDISRFYVIRVPVHSEPVFFMLFAALHADGCAGGGVSAMPYGPIRLVRMVMRAERHDAPAS